MVTAPPSHGPKGDYQFVAGGLNDLGRLPTMGDVPGRALPEARPLADRRQRGEQAVIRRYFAIACA